MITGDIRTLTVLDNSEKEGGTSREENTATTDLTSFNRSSWLAGILSLPSDVSLNPPPATASNNFTTPVYKPHGWTCETSAERSGSTVNDSPGGSRSLVACLTSLRTAILYNPLCIGLEGSTHQGVCRTGAPVISARTECFVGYTLHATFSMEIPEATIFTSPYATGVHRTPIE